MPRKVIPVEELLVAAQKTENAIGRFNTLRDALYNLAGDLDAMWEGNTDEKLMAVLINEQKPFLALPDLLESHSKELRRVAELYAECPKPPWNTDKFR